MIPALRTLAGMILRPGKIGKVAIGGKGPTTAWRPRSPHIHAVFILHAASLGKAVAEQGIVSGRIEPLHSREREMIGNQIRCRIERGDGSTITCCRFATYRPAMGNIAIIYTHIPEGITFGSKPLVQLHLFWHQRKGERGIETGGSDMPALMAIVDVATHQRIGGYILPGYLPACTVQTSLENGLDATFITQRGIYLAIREESGKVESLQQGIGGCCSLQIVGRRAGGMNLDLAGGSAQRGQYREFAEAEVVVENQSHSLVQPIPAQGDILPSA